MVLDFIEILKVIFLGIVEGITEWLPIPADIEAQGGDGQPVAPLIVA